MKFLVLGVSGMAGHVIALYLKERGHQVLGYSRRPVAFVDCIAGDARETAKLIELIDEKKFDVVINAVGLLNQFAENDHEAAVFLNSYLPHFLAKITRNMFTKIVHMSTDCVFSGHTGPYTEDSPCDGQTFYDRSKALGELRDQKNITLRNSIIGPDINENGIGLLNWFMKQSGTVNGYTKVMWTGLTTLQLAKVMEAAVEQNAVGLVNMVYEKNISKYELLKLFNHHLRNDELKVVPFDGFVADKTLLRTNFDFKYYIPSYDVMIAEMADWMRQHRELYPHYHFK